MTATTDSVIETAEGRSVGKSKRFYAPELDSLRFMAFLLVFCRHVTTTFGAARHEQAVQRMGTSVRAVSSAANMHGDLSPLMTKIQGAAGAFDFGVCLFFFLSSYLITRLLLIEQQETGTVNVRDFYIRRSLRIWPLYFTFLGLMSAFAQFFPLIRWTRVVASLFFVANWPAVFYGWTVSPIDVIWSVSVEEQFYLIWPNFARRGRQAILVGCGLMFGVSAITLAYLGSRQNVLNSAVWANTLVQGVFFAGGALAGVYLRPETYRIQRAMRVALLAAGFACWLIASTFCNIAREISPGAVSLLTGYGLILLGTLLIFLSFSRINPKRLPGAFTYFGKISYGLYVVHVLMLQLALRATLALVSLSGRRPPLIAEHAASAVVAFAATLLVGSVSYKFLEAPFLVLKKRFTIIQSRPV